jgi:hypothetical protein
VSEERLQEIKDSVNFQREILLAHNMGTLCVDEEQELVEEIERLHSIIKEVREYINKYGILDLNGYDLLEILDKVNRPTVKPYKVEDNIQVGNVFFVGGE